MKHRLLARSFLPLALLLLAAPARAQEPAVPVLQLAQLEVYSYPVQNTDPDELFDLAEDFVGRSFVLQDRGPDPVFNLMRLGSTIVVYDTPEQTARARELFKSLDTLRPRVQEPRWVEYKPRFVSLETAAEAIKSMVEIDRAEQSGLLLFYSDSQETLAEAQALLQRIDVPQKQVLISCQLIELEAGEGPALPKELVDNLQRLLPGSPFTQVGFALLKTSVGGREPLSIQIESTGKRYLLNFTPVAFDEASSSLTIAYCRLVEDPDGPEERELFSTNTVLRGNEYMVLAATGATPRLLVVRVAVQG
jgi:hypothetical protein